MITEPDAGSGTEPVASQRNPRELRSLWDQLEAEAKSCTRCALASTRTNVVVGTGNREAKMLLVGEGPGAEEDRLGEPFVGRSGQLLDRLLMEEMGIDRSQCYIANVVKCRPPNNRDPKPEEAATCRPYLDRQISLLSPEVIVTLGNVATKAILERSEGISKLRAASYPWRGSVVVPTYHPAAALRGGATVVAEMRSDLVRAKLILAGGGQ
jgi:uracil-DNA glycosylase family 4